MSTTTPQKIIAPLVQVGHMQVDVSEITLILELDDNLGRRLVIHLRSGWQGAIKASSSSEMYDFRNRLVSARNNHAAACRVADRHNRVFAGA